MIQQKSQHKTPGTDLNVQRLTETKRASYYLSVFLKKDADGKAPSVGWFRTRATGKKK